MQKIIKMVVVLLITSTCWAQSDQLLVDQYFSPYTGAALNLSAFHAYIYVDDTWFPSSENEETVPWFVARTLKLGAEELLSELLMVVQHEIFGHGYRLREYHFSDVGYRIGIGYGSTGFLDSEFNTLPYPKRAAVAAAGMEANAIFSQQIRQKWITSDQVDRREATLYLITTLDQSEYILGVEDDLMYMGNDVNAYVFDVNTWYGNNRLSKSKLGLYALWDYLDPSLYVGLYSMAKYLVNGAPYLKMATFDVGNYKYIFCPRLLLAPFGPEFQLQNYLVTPGQKLWNVNVRYGNNSQIHSWGADIFLNPIWTYENWQVGNKFYVWKQPLFLKQNTAQGVPQSLGFADFVGIEYKLNHYWSAVGEFGYKTAGYIQGIPLGNSYVWRLGVSLLY